MLYMVVEKFTDAPEIYRRFAEKGRLMPEGLYYVSSWVDLEVEQCFQLMETEDYTLIDEWISNWQDLADFEVFPVITSAEAKEKISKR